MKIKKSIQSLILSLIITNNSVLASNPNDESALPDSQGLLEYSIKAYYSGNQNIPSKFPASASDYCYNQEDKPLEVRAYGCHASFLLQFIHFRSQFETIENARTYVLSITGQTLGEARISQNLTKYYNALDRIRTSIDTMVSDGFEAQINYSRLGIDWSIDQIGILIADISDRNQEIMKTIGIIDNYLEILDRKRY